MQNQQHVPGRRPWRSTTVVGALAAMALVAATDDAASAAGDSTPTPKSPAAARALREQQHVFDLVNAASNRVTKTRKTCSNTGTDPETPPTHEAPPAPVLGAIAALRRPQAPEDQLPAKSFEVGLLGTVYEDYTREVTAADGRRFVIVPTRYTPEPAHFRKACWDAERTVLVRSMRHETVRVRRRALRELARNRRTQREYAAHPRPTEDDVLLFTRTANGSPGGGGGGSFARFRTHGTVVSSGSGSGSSRLSGLVPDGVASVTLTYPKRVGRGRYYRPTVFPHRLKISTPVQQNVFSVEVARGAPDAFASRTVWRDAAGHVVRAFGR